MTSATTADLQTVADVVEQWRARFEASDAEGMKALWDRDHAPLTYLPTEREKVMTNWSEINDYYDRVCGSLDVTEWRVWDVIVDLISEQSAFAFAFAYTDFIYQSRMNREAGDQYWEGRISFHVHRRDGAWKIIHYEDSTLMQWMIPLVSRWQATRIDAIEAAVRSGDSALALDLLGALRTPPSFGDLTAIARRKD